MIYKVSYFKIPLNNQISVKGYTLRDGKTGIEELEFEIHHLSEEIENMICDFTSDTLTSFKGKIRNGSIEIIEVFEMECKIRFNKLRDLELIHEYREKENNLKGSKKMEFPQKDREEASFLNKLISLVQTLLLKKNSFDSINNPRFTENYRVELEQHINKIASEGWILFSLTPITKGIRSMSSDIVHEVQEGFVLVWQKNN